MPYLTPTDHETIVAGLVEPTAWTLNPAPSGHEVPATAGPFPTWSPTLTRTPATCYQGVGLGIPNLTELAGDFTR